jgi:hypothetical protein
VDLNVQYQHDLDQKLLFSPLIFSTHIDVYFLKVKIRCNFGQEFLFMFVYSFSYKILNNALYLLSKVIHCP